MSESTFYLTLYIYIGLSLLAVGGIQGWLECPLVTSLGGFNEVI